MILSAVIFDLDGTVVNSEPEWGKAFDAVLKSLGVNVTGDHPETTGVSIKENWKKLIVKYDIKTDKTLDDLRSLTYREYKNFIPQISLNEGAVEFIESLRDSGAQIALATSTSWEVADIVLRNLNIEELFDCITTGEEVVNEKPDPEIFITTAEKLTLDPENCLVIEDSESGVKAAKEAGMKVVAIDITGEKNDLDEADIVVGKFSEITPKLIAQL